MLKKHKAGTKFASEITWKQAVTSWLQTLDINFFYTVVHVLVQWWYKCLNVNSDHVEV